MHCGKAELSEARACRVQPVCVELQASCDCGTTKRFVGEMERRPKTAKRACAWRGSVTVPGTAHKLKLAEIEKTKMQRRPPGYGAPPYGAPAMPPNQQQQMMMMQQQQMQQQQMMMQQRGMQPPQQQMRGGMPPPNAMMQQRGMQPPPQQQQQMQMMRGGGPPQKPKVDPFLAQLGYAEARDGSDHRRPPPQPPPPQQQQAPPPQPPKDEGINVNNWTEHSKNIGRLHIQNEAAELSYKVNHGLIAVPQAPQQGGGRPMSAQQQMQMQQRGGMGGQQPQQRMSAQQMQAKRRGQGSNIVFG